MADSAQPAVRHILAPYISNLHQHVSVAAEYGDIVFYRSGGFRDSESRRDLFAIGPFQFNELPWDRDFGATWQPFLEQYSVLDTAAGPMAGYFSYEAGYAFEQRWRTQLKMPTNGRYAWRLAQFACWYVADHSNRTGAIMAMEGATGASIETLFEVLEQFSNSSFPHTHLIILPYKPDVLAALGEFSQTDYEESVLKILEDIYSGRYYELNFTQRFHTHTSVDPATYFSLLFERLQPCCGFYCGFGGEAVCSFSPELYLRKAGKKLCTRPIKGSMAIGAPASDWEKLYAEHVMVVDLARNDIGRVSDSGGVTVDDFVTVKEFGGLRHMESSILGSSSRDWKDILSHTYPAASITGCPKIEVVQAIQNYERSPRNVYTGSCGWIWPNGDMDLNVAIRTATATKAAGEWKYEIGAGGAIVADSEPALEYLECLRKVHPLISGLMGMNNSA